MASRNEALVRRFLHEVVNGGDARLLAELIAGDHVCHAADGDVYGPEGMRIDLVGWQTGFPDLALAVEDLLADGDRVVSRFVLRGTHAGPFFGLAPTGRTVAVAGVGIERVAGGRLAESWVTLDGLGLLRQLAVT